MSRKIPNLPPIVAVALTALILCASAEASDLHVVVLQNGNILQGKVQLDEVADRYIVSKGPWYTIRVPRSSVDFVAASPAEAYQVKRQRIGRDDVRQHVRLAQWCLRNDFESLAGETLLHIIRLDPHNSAIKPLEQQLLARTQPKKPKRTQVQPASFQRQRAETPSPSDLPALPPNSVAHFTRAIQPLLLNRCGQSACHGKASSNDFKLWQQSNRRVPKALTWKNLRSVLKHVDTNAPNDSRLLTQALTIHGRARRSPFEPHETRQLDQLRQWILDLSNGDFESTPTPSSERPDRFAQRGAPNAPQVSPNLAKLYGIEPNGSQPTSEAPNRPDSRQSSDSGAATATDPFDPAEFNSRGDK